MRETSLDLLGDQQPHLKLLSADRSMHNIRKVGPFRPRMSASHCGSGFSGGCSSSGSNPPVRVTFLRERGRGSGGCSSRESAAECAASFQQQQKRERHGGQGDTDPRLERSEAHTIRAQHKACLYARTTASSIDCFVSDQALDTFLSKMATRQRRSEGGGLGRSTSS